MSKNEILEAVEPVPPTPTKEKEAMSEKVPTVAFSEVEDKDAPPPDYNHIFETTREQALKLEEKIHNLTLERTLAIIKEMIYMHESDPNFHGDMLNKMKDFVADPPTEESDKNETLRLMKIEALLSTEDSPYVEVRANVDPTDNPSLPCSTIRAWLIGISFSCAGTFIDTFFAFRFPGISIGSDVAQFLAYPTGCLLARVVPRWTFTIFGRKFELNPGPFNVKEHMLIGIMANVSFGAPYTFYIIPAQAMPQFFGMSWAYDRGYQVCISIAVNFFGLGMAGLLRRILVYPSVAMWPQVLPTIALVKSFHAEVDEPVRGPFNRIYTWTKQKIFLIATFGMAVYFIIPGFLFQGLSTFSWITWISPNNIDLNAVSGINGGMGFNPWPSFDWNVSGSGGLYLPVFNIVNSIIGIFVAALMILGIWYQNAWQTGYLPINANGTFDNTGGNYHVTKVLDSLGRLDETLFRQYSQPWFSAAFIVYTFWCYASYTASFTFVFLFHREAIWRGIRGIYRQTFHKTEDEDVDADIHTRLMRRYREVPDWHYLVLLILPIFFGIAAVKGWPTGAPVSALFYGLLIPIIFLIPIGLVQAITGTAVPINTLAALLGGLINAGNPNGLIYFKCWAYLSSWQALGFTGDLKIAHYMKIPPNAVFWAQLVATFIYSIISALSYNFIMSIKDVCTPKAKFKMICPAQKSFYSITIFYGVISPKKLFGAGQRYNMMLLGFPVGLVLVLAYWVLRKKYPRSTFIRQIHPVMFCMGPVGSGPPGNISYCFGDLYVNLFTMLWLRKRYLAFWSKWNYVISAAFSCGIALSALFIFFAFSLPKDGTLYLAWWGNDVVQQGCEGQFGCPRLTVAENSTFGPSTW